MPSLDMARISVILLDKNLIDVARLPHWVRSLLNFHVYSIRFGRSFRNLSTRSDFPMKSLKIFAFVKKLTVLPIGAAI